VTTLSLKTLTVCEGRKDFFLENAFIGLHANILHGGRQRKVS
jgi:hypothetical protein